jgi:hypothetical protein
VKGDDGDDGLADFNGDGSLSAADQFSSLLVWRDLDRDAISDKGRQRRPSGRSMIASAHQARNGRRQNQQNEGVRL